MAWSELPLSGRSLTGMLSALHITMTDGLKAFDGSWAMDSRFYGRLNEELYSTGRNVAHVPDVAGRRPPTARHPVDRLKAAASGSSALEPPHRPYCSLYDDS